MAHQSLKNADGTVNLEGVQSHLEYVKGKYAQNAKNYEANTGKKMSFAGGDSAESENGQSTKGEDEGTTTSAEDKDLPQS